MNGRSRFIFRHEIAMRLKRLWTAHHFSPFSFSGEWLLDGDTMSKLSAPLSHLPFPMHIQRNCWCRRLAWQAA